MKIEDDSH